MGSVPNLIGLRQPRVENAPGLVTRQTHERQRAFAYPGLNFAVDRRIVEADCGRVGARVGVIDAVDPGPIDGAETHGTRLAARIDVAALEAEGADGPAGFADRHDLGMRGRIVCRRDLVPAAGDDLAA